MVEILDGSKSNVCQKARLLLAPNSPFYDNNKNSTYLQFPLRLPHTLDLVQNMISDIWCILSTLYYFQDKNFDSAGVRVGSLQRKSNSHYKSAQQGLAKTKDFFKAIEED
jgi:hypothetical protein